MIKKILKWIGYGVLVLIGLGIITSFLSDDGKKEDGKMVVVYMNQLKQQSDVVDQMLSKYEERSMTATNLKERIKIEEEVTPGIITELQRIAEMEVPSLKGSTSEKEQTKKLLEKAKTELYLAQEAKRVAIVHLDDGPANRYVQESSEHQEKYTKACEQLVEIYNLTKSK